LPHGLSAGAVPAQPPRKDPSSNAQGTKGLAVVLVIAIGACKGKDMSEGTLATVMFR